MNSQIGEEPLQEEQEKPSIVEKIVDSITQDIIDVIETVKETEKS